MKTLLTLTSAAALSLGTAGMAQASCDDVTMTEMSWASAAVVTHISKFIMETGYGCTVTAVPSSTVPSLVSVSENGTPDIVSELWINGVPAYEELQDAGTITTLNDVLSDGGVEGWWVPQYMVDEKPELATLEGILANVDTLGGLFHTCPEGWACKNTNFELTRNFGLIDAGYELFEHGSGETLATSIAAAFDEKAPWLGYYWAPTAILGKYPMVSVEMGEYNEEIFKCAADIDCDTTGLTAWPVGPVKTVVTTDFQERQPELAALMENVAFTNAQMGEILSWKEENGASNEEAAVFFITTYSDVWSEWVNDAAKEKLSVLIK